MSTIYASFAEPSDAEKAAGALLDHGALPEDISILSNERDRTGQPIPKTEEAAGAERSAKSGISTTTAYDVAAGTIKGATVGLGIGTLAALAAMFIPGVGLVLGGGALATAFMGGAGTLIAGAATGSVAGLLADQGVPENIVTSYSKSFVEGGAILAVACPTGHLDATGIEALLTKYGAANVATVNAPKVLVEGAATPQPEPLVVQPENPAIAPVAFGAPAVAAVSQTVAVPATPVAPATIPIDPASAVVSPAGTCKVEEVEEKIPPAQPFVDVVDPVTGAVIRRPAETIIPDANSPQATTLAPNTEVVKDAATGQMHQTVGKPTVISERAIVVTDPGTGERRPARLVEEQHAVVRDPVKKDVEGHLEMPVDGPEETTIVREKHIEL